MAYTLTYSYANQAYTVTGYTGTPDDVAIPNIYDNDIDGPHPVTHILDNAFSSCSSLTRITIGNNVRSIGNNAFEYCSSLTRVTMPDGVVIIGDDAFSGCSSLRSITIGNSVTSIGSRAFEGCDVLMSITIPNSVTSIGGYAFYNCGITSITIPDNVTSLGNGVFSNCSGLTSVTIGNSVTSIGEYAFSGCSRLQNIILLPNDPPTLVTNAFTNVSANAKFYCHKSSENAYKTATNWNTYADQIVSLSSLEMDFALNAVVTKNYISGAISNGTAKVALYASSDTLKGTIEERLAQIEERLAQL